MVAMRKWEQWSVYASFLEVRFSFVSFASRAAVERRTVSARVPTAAPLRVPFHLLLAYGMHSATIWRPILQNPSKLDQLYNEQVWSTQRGSTGKLRSLSTHTLHKNQSTRSTPHRPHLITPGHVGVGPVCGGPHLALHPAHPLPLDLEAVGAAPLVAVVVARVKVHKVLVCAYRCGAASAAAGWGWGS